MIISPAEKLIYTSKAIMCDGNYFYQVWQLKILIDLTIWADCSLRAADQRQRNMKSKMTGSLIGSFEFPRTGSNPSWPASHKLFHNWIELLFNSRDSVHINKLELCYDIPWSDSRKWHIATFKKAWRKRDNVVVSGSVCKRIEFDCIALNLNIWHISFCDTV